MATYVAFLRAVNVGRRTYPMAELRAALTAAGFTGVETHIQTGNVLLSTGLRSRAEVVEGLEAAMLADRGFEVPVVLLTPEEVAAAHAEALVWGAGRQLRGHYLTLPARPPTEEGARALEALAVPGEEVRVGARAVHVLLAEKPYHEATMGNAAVERHVGVATTRNLAVVTKLVEKWGT